MSVELKRKLTYKGSHKSQLIDPKLLYGALHELAKINPLYQVSLPLDYTYTSHLNDFLSQRVLRCAIRSCG